MNISQVLTKLKALIYSKSETDSLLGGKANSSHTHTKSQITDFPSLATVATSGSYSDLSNKPTIPTNTNQLTNGAGYITSSGSCNYANYSGYVQGKRASGTYVNEVKYGNALVTTNQTSFGAIWNAPTKNYRVACATYPSTNDEVYLCYSITNDNVSSSTNTTNKVLTWNAGTGILSATGFSGSLTGNVTGNCSGSAGSVAWTNVSGKPSTFTPSSHTHTKSQITDFPTIPSKTSQLTNDSGFLTSHQSLSSRVAIAGDTMTGTLNLKTENNVCLDLRPSHSEYHDTISVQTSGNEAVVFATKNTVTSWMFINGEDSITNHTDSRWQSLTPGLQIKSNKVAIGKLIANGANLTYPLEVNGTVSASSMVVTNNSSNGVLFGSYRVYVG